MTSETFGLDTPLASSSKQVILGLFLIRTSQFQMTLLPCHSLSHQVDSSDLNHPARVDSFAFEGHFGKLVSLPAVALKCLLESHLHFFALCKTFVF